MIADELTRRSQIMPRYGGYCGKILRVDLSNGTFRVQELDERWPKELIGGNGLGASLLLAETPPRIDPLSPESRVYLVTGPLNGTPLPIGTKFGFVFKSPLTDGFMDSYAGGFLGAELKFCGFDAVVLEGRAPHPVYLWIDDGKPSLLDARHLWGKDTYETCRQIWEDHGDPMIRVAAIGPAGENLVRYACVMAEGFHAAGRGGLGAVWGSKNLKAVALRGVSGAVRVADPAAVKRLADEIYQAIRKDPSLWDGMPRYGTVSAVNSNQASGILGTRNWQTEVFEEADKINGEAFRSQVWERNLACFACPIRCLHFGRVKQGRYQGLEAVGPQYETVYALGSLCGNGDPAAILAAGDLCNRLGLDTISAGVCIAFAMECYERGLLTESDTQGLELRFGNRSAIIELVQRIAYRDGIGGLLAEGVKRAAEAVGRGADRFAIHVKGLELAGHSVRGYKGLTLGYATSNRGGSHQDMRHLPERAGQFDRRSTAGKAQLNIDITATTALRDSYIYCAMFEGLIGRVGVQQRHADLINAVAGMELSRQDLFMVAERIWNLERAFNVREGKSRAEDTLPRRFLEEPIPEGPSQGMVSSPEELGEMLEEYYRLRGWDAATGIPSRAKLEALSLGWVADAIGAH